MFIRVPLALTAVLAVGILCVPPALAGQQAQEKKPPSGYVERGPIDVSFGGGRLDEDQIEALEKRLKSNPDDTASRIRLLRHYHAKRTRASRAAHLGHLVWMIENEPGARYGSQPFCRIDGWADPEGYERVRTMWLEQVAAHPRDTGVIENAARFMMHQDKQISEDLLNMAKAIEPENPRWPKLLASINPRRPQDDESGGKADPKMEALQQIEEAYELTDSETQKLLLLSGMAKAAYEAGESRKADSYARQALAAVDRLSVENTHGEAIHQGNIVLGRIAFDGGGIHKAKEHLLAAGRTPGSPTLNSLGPNMGLAKQLLDIDETEVVLEYFELCGEFWTGGSEKLAAWKAVVEEGGVPDFKSNLNY
jgi:hypothetical protein